MSGVANSNALHGLAKGEVPARILGSRPSFTPRFIPSETPALSIMSLSGVNLLGSAAQGRTDHRDSEHEVVADLHGLAATSTTAEHNVLALC